MLIQDVNNLTENWTANAQILGYSSQNVVTVANTVTETSLINGSGPGAVQLPANFFSQARGLKGRIFGVISETATPTVIFKFKLGSTALITSTTLTLPAAIPALSSVSIDFQFNCLTTGASGTIAGCANIIINSAAAGTCTMVPCSMAIAGVTVNTTVAQLFDITLTWGTADAGNTFSVLSGYVDFIFPR